MPSPRRRGCACGGLAIVAIPAHPARRERASGARIAGLGSPFRGRADLSPRSHLSPRFAAGAPKTLRGSPMSSMMSPEAVSKSTVPPAVAVKRNPGMKRMPVPEESNGPGQSPKSHRAQPEDPWRDDPCPTVRWPVHIHVGNRCIGRNVGVGFVVRHPQPAVLSRVDPLPARRRPRRRGCGGDRRRALCPMAFDRLSERCGGNLARRRGRPRRHRCPATRLANRGSPRRPAVSAAARRYWAV